MAGSPLPPADSKASEVRRMFGAIAPRYDLLNHLLSLNRDRAWRRRAVDRLLEGAPGSGVFLDACAGTFDLAVELADRPGFSGTVLGFDFAYPMLRAGRGKLDGRAIAPACADALNLPLADASVDGAMVAFGVRNLASLDAGLAELGRVIRDGGRLVILEFMTPEWQPFRAAYLLYFRRVLPLVGRLVSRHGSAYSYLPASVLEFPEPAELAARLERAGFGDVGWDVLTGGIVAVHRARRARRPIRGTADPAM
ncbi:MAG TPA: ubiquinone/menaquinone biosynthesis methyltransferase [Longimicrobiales bacterium]|nr:ubiquinone/menaquinone biosynthesis methyltransferase [Longimicrobiales bacterium]